MEKRFVYKAVSLQVKKKKQNPQMDVSENISILKD